MRLKMLTFDYVLRIQHNQTQQSLAVLSADVAQDKTWGITKTKEHTLASVLKI